MRILELGDSQVTKNKTLFIQSFSITQNELLQSLEKSTGSKWTVNEVDSESFIEKRKKKAEAGDAEAIEDLVFAVGQLNSDWTKRADFAMKKLGLEDEDLDTVVALVANRSMGSRS